MASLVSWLQGDATALRYSTINGNLWSGRIERIEYQQLRLGPVVWKMQPLALLSGAIEYRVFFQSAEGGGELLLGRSLISGIYVEDVQALISAQMLGQQLPLTVLSGQLQLNIQRLVFSEDSVEEVRGEVIWQEATIEQPIALQLTQLQFLLDSDEENIKIAITDNDGPLDIDINLSLAKESREYQIKGYIKARKSASNDVKQTLTMLGSADRSGRYKIEYSGKI